MYLGNAQDFIFDKPLEMAEAKLASLLLWIFGVPTWGYILYVNMPTWKADVMFFTSMGIVAFTYYWRWRRRLREDRKAEQEEKLRDLEIRLKEFQLNERKK